MESSGDSKSLISVGRIIKPFGVKGEVVVEILTDFPLRFFEMEEMLLVNELTADSPITVSIESARIHKDRVLLKMDIINQPEEVERFRNWHLKIHKEEVQELPPCEFYIFELIGLEVWTTSEQFVGVLKKVLPAGDNDVYEIHHPESRKVNLIPARKEFIKDIILKTGRILVEPIEGLLEL